jgi:hypothetical protein
VVHVQDWTIVVYVLQTIFNVGWTVRTDWKDGCMECTVPRRQTSLW